VSGALALGVVPAEDLRAVRNRLRAQRPATQELDAAIDPVVADGGRAVSESRVA
jgi:hypothetical protein